MGLLSALGKRGVQALESGQMFGGALRGGSGAMSNTDRMLAQVLKQAPNATDEQIGEAVFGESVRAGLIKPEDVLELVRTYRARALQYAPDDYISNMRLAASQNRPRPDISPYAPRNPYSPYVR